MSAAPLSWALPWLSCDRLLLAEVQLELRLAGIERAVLLRASEVASLPRLARYGTDRGGFPGDKPWRFNAEHGLSLRHEDVILATTPFENHVRTQRSSLSKIAEIDDPLVLVYDRGALRRLQGEHWAFREPSRRAEALLAIATVTKHPAIEGWFSDDKGEALRGLVDALPDGARMVEVGSWCGRSTSWIARLCRRRGIALTCVDHFAGSTDTHDAAYRRTLAERDVRAEFLANLQRAGADAEQWTMASIDAAARMADHSLHLVFLDASHDEAAMRADLQAWRSKLAPGGTLAGDDYHPDYPGVIAAVDELAARLGRPVLHPADGLWALRETR